MRFYKYTDSRPAEQIHRELCGHMNASEFDGHKADTVVITNVGVREDEVFFAIESVDRLSDDDRRLIRGRVEFPTPAYSAGDIDFRDVGK